MRKPLKTHATATRCRSSTASAGAAELADGSNMRLHPSQRNGSTSRFFAIPSVHNFYFCGFGVRPGPANYNLTGIYDDLRAWDAGYRGIMSDISTKYDKIYRYMLKNAMAKYILYGN